MFSISVMRGSKGRGGGDDAARGRSVALCVGFITATATIVLLGYRSNANGRGLSESERRWVTPDNSNTSTIEYTPVVLRSSVLLHEGLCIFGCQEKQHEVQTPTLLSVLVQCDTCTRFHAQYRTGTQGTTIFVI